MKKITYTLIAEGYGEYAFLENLISRLAVNFDLQTKKTPLKISASSNPSKSKVLGKVNEFCNLSFQPNTNVDLFIAGVDLDEVDYDLQKHAKQVEELQAKLGNLYKLHNRKIVFFIPIQTIDYWVLYLKVNATPHSLESRNSKEVKNAVYGKKADRYRIEQAINKVMTTANFEQLAKQSKSFRVFYQQLEAFFKEFN